MNMNNLIIIEILKIIVAPIVIVVVAIFLRRYLRNRDQLIEEYQRHQKNLELAVYSKRGDLYEMLINFMTETIKQDNYQKLDTNFMAEFKSKLAFYGSDETLRKFIHIMERYYNGIPYEQLIKEYGELFILMRRDMGYPETRLSPNEIWRCIIDIKDWKRIDKLYEISEH